MCCILFDIFLRIFFVPHQPGRFGQKRKSTTVGRCISQTTNFCLKQFVQPKLENPMMECPTMMECPAFAVQTIAKEFLHSLMVLNKYLAEICAPPVQKWDKTIESVFSIQFRSRKCAIALSLLQPTVRKKPRRCRWSRTDL